MDESSSESALYEEIPEEAVKLAEAVGALEASRRLSIPLKSLANWQRAAKAGKLEEVGRQQKPQTELEAQLDLHVHRNESISVYVELGQGHCGLDSHPRIPATMYR